MAALIPSSFLDPVTYEIMVDPVMTCDGHTFERVMVERWFAEHSTNPLTNAVVATKVLTINIAVRKGIAEWRAAHYKIIPRQAIEIGRQCGVGSFKQVFVGTLHLPGAKKPSTVAVLKVRSGDVAAEIEILLKLGQHPRLVQFLGMCVDGVNTLLVTEFAPMGDLHSKLEDIEDTITPAHQV